MLDEEIFIHLATHVTEFCTVAQNIFVIIIASALLEYKSVCHFAWSEQKVPE